MFELVDYVNTHSFVLAMIRFINIYDIPSHIYSDNAWSFLAGGNLFTKKNTSSEFTHRLGRYDIKHLTIPMYSPWFGSVWEILIKIVKNCMYKSINRGKTSYFDLLTELSDIQNAVNFKRSKLPTVTFAPIIKVKSFLKLMRTSFWVSPLLELVLLVLCLGNHVSSLVIFISKNIYKKIILGEHEAPVF